MKFLEDQISKITDNKTRIVYPEGLNPNILKGIGMILGRGIATPVIIGDQEEIEAKAVEVGVDLTGTVFVSPKDPVRKEAYAKLLASVSGLPETVAGLMLKKPLYFGTMMVKAGDADCIIAGSEIETDEVVAAYKMIIGLKEGISVPSCISFVELESYRGEANKMFAMSDTAINIEPSIEELADIALTSASTVQKVMDPDPRVAMLSFSTMGSSTHERAKRMAEAARLVKERAPELKVDGELQLDAAVVPEVAARKVKRESDVAGSANVLVLPSLEASNIGIKLLQRFGGAKVSGLLQGFAKPACDLSRGATEEYVFRSSVLLIRIASAK